MASPLEHYGLIGDTRTVALVSRSGSIDWLCLPRIDSDACFAQLVGTNRHGYWSLRPAAPIRGIHQHYRPDTLVLETDLTCDSGRARIIDFMVPNAAEHDIIRIVAGVEGEVPMHGDLSVRFGYGKLIPWIKVNGHRATLTSGPDALAFYSAVPIAPDYECDTARTARIPRARSSSIARSLAGWPRVGCHPHGQLRASRRCHGQLRRTSRESLSA